MKGPYYELGDWVSNNVPNWTAWLGHLKGVPDVRALEIGTCEGRGARWFLDHILTDPSSQLVCVDPFPHRTWERNLAPERSERRGRVTLERRESSDYWQTFDEFGGGPFDLIYIDGDHSAKGVLEDAVCAWWALKPGGILLFDDYRWRLESGEEWDRPGPSIDAFLSAYRRELVRLEDVPGAINPGWQIAVRKRETHERRPEP